MLGDLAVCFVPIWLTSGLLLLTLLHCVICEAALNNIMAITSYFVTLISDTGGVGTTHGWRATDSNWQSRVLTKVSLSSLFHWHLRMILIISSTSEKRMLYKHPILIDMCFTSYCVLSFVWWLEFIVEPHSLLGHWLNLETCLCALKSVEK